MTGKLFLAEKDLVSAFKFYKETGNTEGCAYCKFLEGDYAQTVSLLNVTPDSSSFSRWLLFLTALINGIYKTTTYLSLRNFYEQDLEMLFYYGNLNAAKKLLNENKYLEQFNREIYKYSARVLLNNGYFEPSKKMLLKSIEIFYRDPETHFMIAETERLSGNIKKAIHEYKISSEIAGFYKPAGDMLKKFEKYE